MRGDDTLWLPGVDHASIAAQFVLDKIIAEEGETRASLGRERYLERMWQFMDETRDVIGRAASDASGRALDWTRLRFTMDAGSARAVRVAFKRLWDAGLVYRGEALVNWCPRCRTTISDLENVHREETGTLWTIRYHLAREDGTPDPDRWISVATTRPETILGDTAVAVHPDDDRYRDLVGREAILPFLGRRLPIVADAVGRARVRHRRREDHARPTTPTTTSWRAATACPLINVLDEDGADERATAASSPGWIASRPAPRSSSGCATMGDLEGERPHQMVIGHCERCGTVVEPRLSVQWFVRTEAAGRARARIGARGADPDHPRPLREGLRPLDGEHPRLGGRPPAVVGPPDPGLVLPGRPHHRVATRRADPTPARRAAGPAAELTQETDIFDTWFSSGLWPFSTLGWPDDDAGPARASTRPR